MSEASRDAPVSANAALESGKPRHVRRSACDGASFATSARAVPTMRGNPCGLGRAAAPALSRTRGPIARRVDPRSPLPRSTPAAHLAIPVFALVGCRAFDPSRVGGRPWLLHSAFAASSIRRYKLRQELCGAGKKTRKRKISPCAGGAKWDRKSFEWGTVGSNAVKVEPGRLSRIDPSG